MNRQQAVRLSSLLLVLCGLVLLISGGLSAHPSLKANESSPAPGDLLSASPAQVRLVFNVEADGLVADQSFFWVYKEAGSSVVALGKPDLSVADRNVMTASLPTLTPGVYRVKWVAISGSDTGFSEGSYSFAVK